MNSLVNNLAENIKTDSAIGSWADTTCDGADISVFRNMDPLRGVSEEDCPAVIVNKAVKTGGEDQEEKTHTIEFVCVVHDDTQAVTTSGVANWPGGDDVESLRGLVMDVIQAYAAPLDLRISAAVTEYAENPEFLFFITHTELTLVESLTMGSDRIE